MTTQKQQVGERKHIRLPDGDLERINDIAARDAKQGGEVQGDGLSWADYWIGRGCPDVAHDYVEFTRAEDWASQRFAARQPVAVHGVDLSPIATRKLGKLAAQGYVTNGVAIFNPATGHRGLVDNLGFVGWMGAQGIELGQSVQGIPGNVITHRRAWRKALEVARDAAEVSPPDINDHAYWEHEIRAFDRTFDRLWALIEQRDAGAGVES